MQFLRRATLLPKLTLAGMAAFLGLNLAIADEVPKLMGHAARTSPGDLEVYALNEDGTHSASTYFSYADFLKLPQVTVKRDSDPETKKPASYSGPLLSDVAAALGVDPAQQIIGLLCADHYKQYYDAAYMSKHQPIMLLKYDGKPPEQWPLSEHNTPLGPYYIVHESFVPAVTVDGYTEDEKIPFGVVALEISTLAQSLAKFAPPASSSDAVMNGYKIAMGSCVSCHNLESAGGSMAQRPWSVLETLAVNNGDYFNAYVVNPQKFKAKVAMPAHPTFDDKTLYDLRAYFKAMSAAMTSDQ